MNNLISIIIPSYNCGLFVSDAIESVLVSNVDFYELIIVDDGSTDNTKELLIPYFLDGRIKYLFQKNKGLSGARNTGINEAKGDFLVFLDADDLISPVKLEVQSKYLKDHPEVDIVYSNSQWFVENDFNDTRPVQFPIYEGDVLGQLIYGNFMHVNSVMVRKDKVIESGLFDESLRELEDWDLWLRMVLSGCKVGFTLGILSKVRIRKGSMTSNQNKMDLTMVRVLQKTIQNLRPNHPIQMKAHHALLIYQLKAGDTKDYVFRVIRFQKKFGIKFSYISLKQIVKLLIKPWLKLNKTTLEIEKIWNKK